MTVSADSLTAVAQALRVVRSGATEVLPGEQITAKLVPDPAEIRVTDILPGDVDLTFITKNIGFDNSQVQSSLDAAALNDDILEPSIPGITGVLGQLAGTLPIKSELPVKAEVTWSVLDEAKEPLVENVDFFAPDGLDVLEPSFLFPFRPAHDVVELTLDPPEPIGKRFIRATVKLTVGSLETNPPQITLPDVPVVLPKIAVPTLLALFLHSDFNRGAVLIVVPSNSPLKSFEQAQPILNQLDSTIQSIRGKLDLGSFLLGLPELTGALNAQPHVQFRASNQISNLNDITLIQRGFFENDTEAEDELSSLIFIGPPDKKVRCYIAREFGGDRFELTIKEDLYALIRTLHVPEPVTEPASATIDVVGGADSFGDELSSLSFEALP